MHLSSLSLMFGTLLKGKKHVFAIGHFAGTSVISHNPQACLLDNCLHFKDKEGVAQRTSVTCPDDKELMQT